MNRIKISKRQLPSLNKTSIIVQKDHEYCIINQENQFYAIDNLCPHKQASLGLGEICKDEISCPLHDYKFNFKTGKCSVERHEAVRYEIEIIED